MRVLIINKFLYPNGGSETYIFKLGEALEQHGHEVQYFGMEHEGRCVGNRVNAYATIAGIQASRGRYIAFLDPDDRVGKDFISRFIDLYCSLWLCMACGHGYSVCAGRYGRYSGACGTCIRVPLS